MRNRISFVSGCVAAALIVCLAGCSSQKAAVKAAGERKTAPEFALKDASGSTVKMSDYKGKVVLLNFWATWCGPCKVEIPWFIEFEQNYRAQNFAVLGVSLDEDGWTSVKPYLEQKKINYRVMIGTDEVSQLYGSVDSLPTTIIIDRQGRIASAHIGLPPGGKKTYIDEIQYLLNSDGTKAVSSRFSSVGEFAVVHPDVRPNSGPDQQPFDR